MPCLKTILGSSVCAFGTLFVVPKQDSFSARELSSPALSTKEGVASSDKGFSVPAFTQMGTASYSQRWGIPWAQSIGVGMYTRLRLAQADDLLQKEKTNLKQTQTKNQMQTVRPTHFKNQTKAVQCSAFTSLGLWKSILLLKDKHTSGIPVASFSFSGQVQN